MASPVGVAAVRHLIPKLTFMPTATSAAVPKSEILSAVNTLAGPPVNLSQVRLYPGAAASNKPFKLIEKKNTMSIMSLAGVSTNTSTVSNDELIRKADAYFATDSRPIVLFDECVHMQFKGYTGNNSREIYTGVCNFCNGGVNLILENDPVGRLRFAALQSEAGKALLLRSGRSSHDISTLVLVEMDRSYIKSEGVLRTAQYLQSFLPPLGSIGLLFPLFFRDFVYDNVANNRYSFLGQRDVCRVSDARFKDRFVE